MEFWGVEVKAGKPLKVRPEPSFLIHLSQACLGETKKDKGNDSILLNLKVGHQKFVLGQLSSGKLPQLGFDLVFEKEFELSHNWKNGCVYFSGYQSQYGGEMFATDDFSDLDDSEEEEDVVPAAVATENGKPKPATVKSNAAKPESFEKPNVKAGEPSKDSDDEDGSKDESDGEDMMEAESDDDENSDEEEDEETPKKAEPSKKRANPSAKTTPVSAKKAKADSAQKSGGKKGPHTATPHPAKNARMTAETSKSKAAQTPKSGGQFSCKSCSKSFGSENALQSHSKAKHGGN